MNISITINTRKTLLSIFTLLAISVNAQNVNIPDANFKAYLLGNSAINTDADPSEISVVEAAAFTGAISVFNQGVTDLTGIEAFASLTNLNCGNNTLTTIDLSQNTALTTLRCLNASLTALDINQNILLTLITCGNNPLNSLNVTQNTNLITLECYNNSLISLDVSQNVSLELMSCNDNSINSLDVSNNTNLTGLFCYENSITSLDVSNNTALEKLRCNNNSISSLDLSNNNNLITVVCSNNNLTELNIANGNNTNIGSGGVTGIVSVNNPNLTCIQVDDAAYSTTNWTGTYFEFDAASSFNTNCSTVLVSSITVQSQGGASTITTPGGTLQMEATVLPANADDMTYAWSVLDGSGTATISTNGLLSAITDGTVTVIANANDGSGIAGTTTITISNQTVGLNQLDSKNISIYPNPVQNELFIVLDNEDITKIDILDLSGKMIKSARTNTSQIDVSELSEGIYILQVYTQTGVSNTRFVKQ
jgi:hypothetical protein